ncbi:hypothetical protein EMCRGX_G021238 [Ephydatia muelleri]
MDKLKTPLRIPPEFSNYAEEKQIFEHYERMLEALLIERPSDPLSFLAAYLERAENEVHRIIVYGPPASGQHTISKLIARKLRAVHVQPRRILDEGSSPQAKEWQESGKEITPSMWAELIQCRLKQSDCTAKGWVLEGFPWTRLQALELQAKGVIPHHFVHLSAPDVVLIERYAGKRIDSVTGDVYHLIFNPAPNAEIADRLDLLACYGSVAKKFNADQPLNDILSQVQGFLCTRQRSVAPHTPRVLLLGPIGSGRSLHAAQLARKYRLVDVDCSQLIKQTLVSGSKMAEQMKPFYEKKMLIPDDMVMQCLTKRLSQLDCTSRGWVLHGYPLNRDQAELLANVGYKPNRVIFMNVLEDTVKERLTLRRLDPVTGQRYHMLLKPPLSQEISERLVTHPHDTEEHVTEAYGAYQAYIEELMDYYKSAQHVNADQDPLTVAECIESILVNPLPKQPAA